FVALGPITGRLMHKAGRRIVACSGFTVGEVLLLALTQAGPDDRIVWIGAARFGVGLGVGLRSASIVGEGMEALPGAPGLAGGINNTARQLGTSFGVAASGAIIAHRTPTVAGVHLVGVYAAGVWMLGAIVAMVLFTRPSE